MERIDLSTHARDIQKAYDAVVSGSSSYAIFTTQSDSSLKPTAQGNGDIQEFVSEFEEGAVQFGVLKVSPFGSDVNKIVLLGWCPDSAPLKSRVSYARHLADVGKVLHYHVDITARDSDDLDVDDIMNTVSKASGARYSIQTLGKQQPSGFKPKPKSSTASSSSLRQSTGRSAFTPSPVHTGASASGPVDEWGGEEEVEVRDFSKKPLTNLPSAYTPTKVDINALRKSKPAPVPKKATPTPPVEVTPAEPVKEAPIKTTPLKPSSPSGLSHQRKTSLGTVSINLSGGLTELPKHKTSNAALSRYKQEVVSPEYGTKVPTFDGGFSKDDGVKTEGLKKFSDKGLTPAQLWAKKKGQYVEGARDTTPVNASSAEPEEASESVGDVKSKFENLNVSEAPVTQSIHSVITGRSSVSSLPPRETPSPLPPREPSTVAAAPAPLPPRAASPAPLPPREASPAPLPPREPSPVAAAPAPLPPRATPAAPKEETFVAVAEYDYDKDEENEISLVEGETVSGVKKIDPDWWMGTNSKGESGLFPSSYVTIKGADTAAPAPAPVAAAPEPVKAAAPAAKGPSATAEYDYDAAEDNELTFKEGDVITDIEKVDPEWWLGSLNGVRKLFPSNYVSEQ